MIHLFFYCLLNILFLHPIHKVYIELRYNTEKKIIENSFRFSTADIELFLRGKKKKKYDIEKFSQKELQELFLSYFQKNVSVKNGSSKIIWDWVGTEVDYPYMWFYLESSYTELSKQKPTVTLFCELSDEFNFISSIYENQQLIRSDISVCNPHTYKHP